MHNIKNRRGIHEDRDKSNINLMDQALSYDMSSHWISAADLSLNTTFADPAVWFTSRSNMPHAWGLQDAMVTGVNAYVRRHLEWRDGLLYIIPHMSCDTNTGNVVLFANVHRWEKDTVSPTIVSTAVKTLAVPAVASTLFIPPESTYLSSTTWTSAITEQYPGLIITFGRDGDHGSDSCTGTVFLFGIELRYLEGGRDLGQAHDPQKRNF